MNAPKEHEFRDENRNFENRRTPRNMRDGCPTHDILVLEEILVPTEVSVDELFSSVSSDISGGNQHSEHYSNMGHSQGRKSESIDYGHMLFIGDSLTKQPPRSSHNTYRQRHPINHNRAIFYVS